MIDFLVENWYILVAQIAVITIAAFAVYTFIKMPRSAQIKKVKEWLLWAVAEAEKELGSGTGQLKLRYVYNMFVTRFPAIAAVISFETFSKLVDQALKKLDELLSSNKDIEAYVEEV